MNGIDTFQFVKAIPPAAIKDNAAFASYAVDTAIPGSAKRLVFAITLGAIDVDMAVLKVMASDTLTNPTTLGGVPVEVVDVLDTVTPGPDDDNDVLLVAINLQGEHKRYIQLQATAGDGSNGAFLSAVAFFENAGVPGDNLGAAAYIEA